MTNLSSLSYSELQAIAKGFGVPANLKREALEPIVSAMMFQAQASATPPVQEPVQETAVPVADVFAEFTALPVVEAPVITEWNESNIKTSGYVSPKLLKFACDLFTRFGFDKSKLNGMDFKAVQAEVARIQSLPFPMSEKQRTTIENIIVELAELNAPVVIPQEMLESLTGGAQGTAGKLIDKLFRLRTEAQANGPLTDKQAETLAKWMYCPDMPWEDFGISLRVPMVHVSDTAWRYMLDEEFMAELKAVMLKPVASKFIDDYGHFYYAWKKTRATQYQIDTIRQIEQRLANVYTIGVKEYALVDGVMTETYKKSKRQWNPQAYVPMTDEQMIQLSATDASKLIDQMNFELKSKQEEVLNEDNLAQQRLEEKHNKFNERTNEGRATDELSALNREHQALVDFVFQLESAVGHTDEELHESINETMILKTKNGADTAYEIREFIRYAVDGAYITVTGLSQMCRKSQVASKLVEALYPSAYDDATNGRKDADQRKAFNATVEPAPVSNQQQATEDFINNL